MSRVSEFSLTRHITGHYGDQTYQARLDVDYNTFGSFVFELS